MQTKQVVEFFFSPGSRYSYLAASQMPALEADAGCTVDWRPVHGPDLRRRGAFGVPTFFVGDRMFWGNDRLVLLRHHLTQSATPP